MRRPVVYVILFFSLLRLVAAATIELANDESYYWLFSTDLYYNYFDHPPIAAVWIRVFSLNHLLDEPWGLRFGSIVAAAAASFLMYRTVALVKSERAGFYAALLYNCSLFAGITAGMMAMPDAPQMLFWVAAMYFIARISIDENRWANWLGFGAAAGLCIMCKVHGILLWFGFGLYALVAARSYLASSKFWSAAFLTALIASPILIWNLQHDFITWRFHSERVVVTGHAVNPKGFLAEIASQLLVNNPFTVLLLVCALLAGTARRTNTALKTYLITGGAFIGLLLFMSLFRKTLPHWSGAAYISLIPFAAIFLDHQAARCKWPFRLLYFSAAFHIVTVVALIVVINFYPGTFGERSPGSLGKGDITLDTYGRSEAASQFKNLVAADSTMPRHAPLISNTWWGAHDEYYFGRAADKTMIAIGDTQAIHHYAWLNPKRSSSADTTAAWCIINSDEVYDAEKAFEKYYSLLDTAATITTLRNRKPAHSFFVLRLRK